MTTADVTGATTVYWTPHLHNRVAVYDGSAWQAYTSAELSLALGTLTSGANYDVFVWSSSGTLALKLGPAWTSDTARGTGAGTTELTQQDGAWVNKVSIAGGPGAKAGLYLGTLRTTSTTATEDSGGGVTTQVGGKRFLWNLYDRVPRWLAVFDSTDSWTYSTAAYRAANGAAGNKVEFVQGLAGDAVSAWAKVLVSTSGAAVNVASGVGVDSAAANSAWYYGCTIVSVPVVSPAAYAGVPGLGYHYLQWLEYGSGATQTWYGDGGTALIQAGLFALVMA